MKNESVRVRFAPSPTGHLHIGSLRVALFNWLFARHHNGTYLVRIEDTDIKRSTLESVQAIIEGLTWTSLLPDEPILYQSDFLAHHQDLINQLLDEGKAYRCYCPEKPTKDGFVQYEGTCRLIEAKGNGPSVVRLKVPDIDSISFTDLIRGKITIARDQIDDFIIARSDGMPVYNFVVVADDHAMGITQVIRGEDHISNTPKQLLLYQALGYKPPEFAHLPLILNQAGAKLSKRDAVTSVLEYKHLGYIADALCNYLVRLGWSHGDQEIFTREELITLFTLNGVGKSGGAFDQDKLDWVNSVYMQNMNPQKLLDIIIADVEPNFIDTVKEFSNEQLLELIRLYSKRVNTLSELVGSIQSFANDPTHYDEKGIAAFTDNNSVQYCTELVEQLKALTSFDAESIKKVVKQLAKDHSIKLPLIAQPIRLALVGITASPGIFELMAALGKQRSIDRLQKLIMFLQRRYPSRS